VSLHLKSSVRGPIHTDPYPAEFTLADVASGCVRRPKSCPFGKTSAIPEKHRRFFRATFRKIAFALKILLKDAVAPENERDAAYKICANLIFGRFAVAL
jgi:hypothetical protein